MNLSANFFKQVIQVPSYCKCIILSASRATCLAGRRTVLIKLIACFTNARTPVSRLLEEWLLYIILFLWLNMLVFSESLLLALLWSVCGNAKPSISPSL